MRFEKRIATIILIIGMASACKTNPGVAPLEGSALQHACMDELTDVIVHDIFSPPVASRIYSYASLAYYEALRPAYPNTASITDRMKGFPKPAPSPEGNIDARLAAVTAFMEVSEKLVFSKDSIRVARKEMMRMFDGLDKDLQKRSTAWGETIAKLVLARAAVDNYSKTRSMPRYSVFNETGLWKQTPPDYADATEPHWKLITPLMMDSAAHCRPVAPHPYSLDKNSPFYKELVEVYELSNKITPQMDTIARYWDDNPFVSEHKGHLTYANKKITPVGHWISITGILCGTSKADEINTAKAYALASSAMFDGFISCWEEKFRSRTVRPITVIREVFASEWNSLLQTPPFPEYPSGHSVVSAAAATVLTGLFGENFAFHDTSELKYLGLQRSFRSIRGAADEAGISRLYGGIHFRAAIDNGKEQGNRVGQLYLPLIR